MSERQDEGFVLERDDGRGGADVSGHRVQDLHGVLQLQLLIQRNDAGLGPAVSDQDPPQDSIVELHKPGMDRKDFFTIFIVCKLYLLTFLSGFHIICTVYIAFNIFYLDFSCFTLCEYSIICIKLIFSSISFQLAMG